MFKIPKPEYTAEFKELAVKRVKDGQGTGAVAKDLGLIDQYSQSQLLSVGIFFASFPSETCPTVARITPLAARFPSKFPKIPLSVIRWRDTPETGGDGRPCEGITRERTQVHTDDPQSGVGDAAQASG